MAEQNQKIINIKEVIDIIFKEKKFIAKVVIAAFVLSTAWILPQPRTYKTEVMLAPETTDPTGGGSLSSLASSFGFNIGGLVSNDAIYPTLYPDFISSPNFLLTLFDVEVETEDGETKCDYYTYLFQKQKFSFWLYPMVWTDNFIKSLTKNDEGATQGKGTKLTAANLTKKQLEIIDGMKGRIKCTVDKKTDVATITVEDQDRQICAQIADTVRVKLQEHITEYRTKKARQDYNYYASLAAEAKANYEKARRIYASYADANTDVSLKSFQSKMDDLENDMQLKYNTYSAIMTRVEAARAKVQEVTPAFTVLHEATKPRKAAGPKRMLFVGGSTILAFIGAIVFKMRRKKEKK